MKPKYYLQLLIEQSITPATNSEICIKHSSLVILVVRTAYLTEFLEYITHYIHLIGSPSFHKYYDKQGAITAELHYLHFIRCFLNGLYGLC